MNDSDDLRGWLDTILAMANRMTDGTVTIMADSAGWKIKLGAFELSEADRAELGNKVAWPTLEDALKVVYKDALGEANYWRDEHPEEAEEAIAFLTALRAKPAPDALPDGWNVCDRCGGLIPPGETNIGAGDEWGGAELCGKCYAALVEAGMTDLSEEDALTLEDLDYRIRKLEDAEYKRFVVKAIETVDDPNVQAAFGVHPQPDHEDQLEAQGFDDWLRTDPGRRLAAVEARLGDLEEHLGRLAARLAAAGA